MADGLEAFDEDGIVVREDPFAPERQPDPVVAYVVWGLDERTGLMCPTGEIRRGDVPPVEG